MAHHEPLKALCPAEWDDVSGKLPSLLSSTFADAQTVIDSIPALPASSPPPKASTGRARSNTAPAPPDLSKLSLDSSAPSPNADHAAKLRKEWKDASVKDPKVKGLKIYKMSGKDGKGSWFARHSLHTDVSFDKFRAGLEREFAECLKARKAASSVAKPGEFKVRGIGAEKRVERIDVRDDENDVGRAEVYLLSAQFPSVAPREFVTLFLSSAHEESKTKGKGRGRNRAPRQFMLVSKPCTHSECPPRSGYVRGQYESVELIREVPVDPQPLRRTRSSIDLTSPTAAKATPSEDFTREAILRAANKVAEDRAATTSRHGHRTRKAVSVSFDVTREIEQNGAAGEDEVEEEDDDEGPEMAVEWLMVTRSDPGGNIPRWIVDRGTPGGISEDAKQFLDWLKSKSLDDLREPQGEVAKDEAPEQLVGESVANTRLRGGRAVSHDHSFPEEESQETLKVDPSGDAPQSPEVPGGYPEDDSSASPVPVGFYGRIAGALGAASSVVTSRIPAIPSFAGSGRATDSEPDLDDHSALQSTASDDDDSSIHSFLSALEGDDPEQDVKDLSSLHSTTSVAPSGLSDESRALTGLSVTTTTPANTDKELKKLEERRRKAQDKIAKMQERIAAASSRSASVSNGPTSEKDQKERDKEREREEAVLAKLRAKHEREVARQEEKYQRELKRLEAKRAHEEKRAAERRRKNSEREARANAATELEAARAERDAARAERDVANRQIDLLKDQVGELQAQNTKLVAILGKHGLLPGLKGEGWDGLKKTMSAADVEGMKTGVKDGEDKSAVGSDKTA